MSFKTATVVLASAVAQNGTFTVTYPTGTGAGSYAPYGHTMVAAGLQSTLSQDGGGMSVSFGATTATVTYKGVTSIPAGTRVTVQLNIRGQNDGDPRFIGRMKRMTLSPTMRIDIGAPVLAVTNGISASQTVTGAGTAFLLNGTTAGVLDVPRNVTGAWTNTAIITVTGLDEYGVVMVESSASGTSFTGKKAFKSITSVTTNATITGAVLGFGDVLGLPVYMGFISQITGFLADNVAETPGTFVGGVQTKPTATTGDVRGTYDPSTTLDGAVAFALVANLTDPTYKGVTQFKI